MNRITKAPDKNQRWCHNNLVSIIDAIVERQTVADWYCNDTFDGRMPINARNCSLFTEFQISERLKFLCKDQEKQY